MLFSLGLETHPGEIVVVYVTSPSAAAAGLASALVERRVAACVNVVADVRSFYRWEGAVQDDAESLLIIKTTREGFDALRDAVVSLHPYAVPEVVAIPVAAGHAPYLEWVATSVATGRREP